MNDDIIYLSYIFYYWILFNNNLFYKGRLLVYVFWRDQKEAEGYECQG